jgi:hypothetical protein
MLNQNIFPAEAGILTQPHNWKKISFNPSAASVFGLGHSVCLVGLKEGYGVKECL